MAGTVRVSRIQFEAGQSTATVLVSRVAFSTGPAGTPTPAVVRVARMRFVTGNPQTPNVKAYRWNGTSLDVVAVGRWTGSTIEELTA